ncbi:cobalamin biosynthesis protein CbiX [Pseudoclavibacter sp. AY1F1]|uniref:sirohydrochlorin chelatase n=1 Tax=Pseudoclavibacter sp. AY1F1 TaxID=2080583 RepID=UPI000CE8D1EC|nr:CbiX/SirB N-terminal domain-containing protein [Pseudoclavibacter sp. AY1F1]PPF46928.1 cobalamin biosynthesis protein CbiX [Pseudoclavibacter sp. AY1F1]
MNDNEQHPRPTILVGASHGTDNADGQAVIRELLRRVRAMRPSVLVVEAFVDVQQPSLVEVLAGLPAEADVVIVPVLLTVGFHTQVDIAEAAAARPGTSVAAPLGPDTRLSQLLWDRFVEAGGSADDGVVIAVAGSTAAAAVPRFHELREQFNAIGGADARLGYGAALDPRVPAAVDLARGSGGAESRRVSIASYLLTPGFFHDRVTESGADIVAAPLGVDDRIAQIILERFDAVAPAAASV